MLGKSTFLCTTMVLGWGLVSLVRPKFDGKDFDISVEIPAMNLRLPSLPFCTTAKK